MYPTPRLPRSRTASSANFTLSRRDLFRAMGLGTAAMAFVPAGRRGLTAAQESTPVPSRPPGGPSVEQKAFDLEYDITKLFRFVADDVRYESYPGILRGAKGALWGLAANSADKALLLAALLEESKVVTRFVVGEIDGTIAATLVDGSRVDEATARLNVARPHVESFFVETPEPVTLTPESQAALDLMGSTYTTMTTAAERRFEDGLNVISTALEAASIVLPEPSFDLPALERQRHVWLQYADGSLWIDLDPTLSGTEPGTVIAAATETLDILPQEWQHMVRMRVVVEESTGETISRRDLLTHEAPSQDLLGLPIAFAHVHPDAFKASGLAIVEAITGTATLYPSLLIGPDVVIDQPIRVNSAPGLVDALGESTAGIDALAEWLEYDIVSPGTDPITVSRTIFDRIGAARRATGQVVAEDVEPAALVEIEGVGSTFQPLLGVTILSIGGARVPAAIAVQQEFQVDDLMADLSLLGVGYQSLLDSFLVDHLIPRGTTLYPHAPNITAVTIGVSGADDGDPDFVLGIDLVHRAFGFAPVADRPMAGHPGMLAGVLSHVAERAVLDGSWVADLGGSALPAVERGVGRVFEEADRQGVEVLTILPDESASRRLPANVSPEIVSLLQMAGAAGLIVIVPERPVDLDGTPAIGWWLVDPVTGTVRDQFETGQGATLVEYAQRVVNFLYGPLSKFRSLGCAIAFVGLLGSVLAYGGAVAAAYDAASNPTATTAAKVSAVLALGGGTGALAGGLLGPLVGCQ